MSKPYTAFDPSMIGKVVSVSLRGGDPTGVVQQARVGKLSHYSVYASGDSYFTLEGWGDSDGQLEDGDTIEVYSWAEPGDSLADIATALTGMFRNQG